jgi:hypothetical protein
LLINNRHPSDSTAQQLAFGLFGVIKMKKRMGKVEEFKKIIGELRCE